MRDWYDDASHHEQTLLSRSYISLPVWNEKIVQWVHHEGSIWRPIAPWADALITEQHLAPCLEQKIVQWVHHEGSIWRPIALLPWSYISLHWLEQKTAQCVYHEESIWRPITPRADTLTIERHLTPWLEWETAQWGIDPMTHRSFLQTNYLCIFTQHYSYTPRTSCLNTIFF